MISRSLMFCLLTVLLIGSTGHAQQSFKSPRLDVLLERRGWIRVGLAQSVSQATVHLPAGGTVVVNGRSINCTNGNVSLKAAGENALVSIPGQPTISAKDIILVPAKGVFDYSGRSYRGRAHVSGGKSLQVINEIMIDDWLKGVLPAEIGRDSPVEALKAQAVTGRSEAIFRLLSPPHASSGFDFCTGVHCQAYKGVGEETQDVRQACDATLGFVLTAGDDIVNAVYHNVCGGVTAGAEDVWDSKPLPGLVPIFDSLRSEVVNLSSEDAVRAVIQSDGTDYFCFSGNPKYANYAKKYFRWTKRIEAAQVARLAGVGTLTDIQVSERRPSGRVRKITVTGTSGSKTYEKELNIRKVFDLWSGLFVLDLEKSGGRISAVTFVGAGNGHGVGLCQHGAREIARRGGTFDQILAHYYRGAKLRRIYRP